MTDERRDDELVLHEEELELGLEEAVYGRVRARKRVEHDAVDWVEPLAVQHGEVDRVAAEDGDSGEIERLEDGSVSIPLFEERLVVRKEVVVRERIVIRKRTVTEERRVEAELRRERLEIDADDGRLENHGEQEEQDVRT